MGSGYALAVDLAGRLGLEVEHGVPHATHLDYAGVGVAAEAGCAQKAHHDGQGRRDRVATDVQKAVGGIGVGAHLEARAIGGTHLEGEDDAARLDGVRAVKAHRAGEALARARKDSDGRADEQLGSLLVRLVRALVRGVQRDGGVQPEGQRLHEVPAVDAPDLDALLATAHELAKGLLGVVSRHVESAGVIVAGAHGDDAQAGPGPGVDGHEAFGNLVNNAVSAKGDDVRGLRVSRAFI